jgi:hypothetical protein
LRILGAAAYRIDRIKDAQGEPRAPFKKSYNAAHAWHKTLAVEAQAVMSGFTFCLAGIAQANGWAESEAYRFNALIIVKEDDPKGSLAKRWRQGKRVAPPDGSTLGYPSV